MLRYALKSLRANLTRLIATGTAVVLGVGFLAAGLMLTDAMRAGLTGDAEEQYAGIDLAVVPDRPGDTSFDLGERLQPEVLDAVRASDGVAAAAGELTASVRVLDDDGEPLSVRTIGRTWIDDDQLNPLELVDGQAPRTDDEVVLDQGLAEDGDVAVGDTVALRTPIGPIDATVVGISRFGGRDSLDPAGTVSFAEPSAATVLGGGTAGWEDVVIRTDGEPTTVQAELRATLPGSVEVQDRATFVERAAAESLAFVSFLRPVLQGFAYLSLFVCGFVIFNTFSVVVTQRFRELALIRAVGGTPAQVRRSLMVEGLGIGVTASVLGIVVGMLFALGLQVALGWFDIELPGAGIRLSFWTVVLCLVAGTLITVLSVMVPAFRAGRTKPVEAMRTAAVDTSGRSKIRAAFGAFFLLAALALLAVNQLGSAHWMLVAPGALLLFVGLLIGGPLLARLFARAVSWPLSRFGLAGRLAVDNSVRNPRRTATTANALVIGLFLVTLVTVSGEAIKTALVSELNELSGSDYLVVSETGLDDRALAIIDDTEGVAATAHVRSALTFDEAGTAVTVSTADFDDLQQTAGVTVIEGSLDGVRNGDELAVGDFSGLFGTDDSGGATSGFGGEQVGDAYGFRDLDGEFRYLTIGALLEAKLDALFLGYLVGEQTFADLVGEQPTVYAFVRVESGQADAVGLALEERLEDYTSIEIVPGNIIGQAVSTVLDFLIGAVNALLGMSVVIALVGIVNTMTLSIFERRHELGLVRALGMTRRHVARMIRLEAVLIGLLGTLIGMAAGVLLGWVVVSSVDSSIDLAFNWARVGLIFLVGLSVGVLAAIVPTRRATRVDMLDAMRST